MKRRHARIDTSNFLSWQRLIGRMVLITVLLFLFGLSGWLWHLSQSESWLGVEPYRVMVIDLNNTDLKAITTWHYMPDQGKLIQLALPTEIEVRVSDGYGVYRLGAVAKLSQIERGDYSLLVTTIESLLGMPFDELLVTQKEIPTQRNEILALIRGQLQREWRNPNSTADLLKLWWNLKDKGQDSFENISLPKVTMSKDEAVDGVQVTRLERLQLDELISNHLVAADESFAGLTIALDNTTGEVGLASFWSRFVRHAGFDVVNMVDSQDSLSQTQLLFSSQAAEVSLGGQVLLKLFPKAEVRVGDTSDYRSEVVIRLGNEAKI